jgi:hypothetical protein
MLLPIGPVRAAALKQARHKEVAARVDDWINSRGLQSPILDETSSTDTGV